MLKTRFLSLLKVIIYNKKIVVYFNKYLTLVLPIFVGFDQTFEKIDIL